MTQKLCKTYQYQESEEEPVDSRAEGEHDEAKEMMGFIMSLSTQDSERDLSTDTESDHDYWSEDEYAVIKAYYENEQEDEEEESETRNIIKALKEQQQAAKPST